MTLAILVARINALTGASEADIRAAVQANWPHHLNFTRTQSALLAQLMQRKQEKPQ